MSNFGFDEQKIMDYMEHLEINLLQEHLPGQTWEDIEVMVINFTCHNLQIPHELACRLYNKIKTDRLNASNAIVKRD